jgi:hypothetical protein
MGFRQLSPRNSHNLFWYINDWKVIDMSEILRIRLGKLKVAINIFACSLIILLLLVPFTTAISTTDWDYQAVENDSYTIGVQTYIYGLAPVMMQRTENLFVTTPGMGHAPVNQMGYSTHLVNASFTDVVTPNADTLYNTAFLELGKEPIVLHVPDTNGRYYVQQMLDAYTNTFNSVGRRTTGTGEGNFAIVGPGWNGSLPTGLQIIKSPTNTVWIIGRILVKSDSDLPNVLALQKQFTLTPLSQYGKPVVAAKNETLADVKEAIVSPYAQDSIRFFEELRVSLKNNPTPTGEAALMAVFDRIGLGKNETPYGTNLDPAIVDGLSRAIKDGDQVVKSTLKNTKGFYINGWTYNTNIGTYGYNYLIRAAITEGGLGANVPEEAIYAKAQTGTDGQPLNGANKYIVHFDKDNMPPVDAFWSLSMYNATTFLFVPNPVNHYSLGDQTTGLMYNPDGSLDIYIQHDEPSGKGSNWLPAPDGDFYMVLRMYLPSPKILNGTYQIPQVQKVV